MDMMLYSTRLGEHSASFSPLEGWPSGRGEILIPLMRGEYRPQPALRAHLRSPSEVEESEVEESEVEESEVEESTTYRTPEYLTLSGS
jgi:hypothetical protein